MRLVQKKCPNCGASVDFGENSKKVKCVYCGQTYFIEKDDYMIKNSEAISNHLEDAFNLVDKVQKPFAFVSTFMFVIIFIVFIVSFISISFNMLSFDDNFESTYESFITKEDSDNLLIDFNQIDAKTIDTFHKESISELEAYMFTSKQVEVVNNWSYVGMYLIVNKTFEYTNLVDVFDIIYRISGKEYHYYGAVVYDRIELSDNGIVATDFDGMVACPSQTIIIDDYNKVFLSGYESLEELYNKEIREYMSSSYIVKNTSDVYMVKANEN